MPKIVKARQLRELSAEELNAKVAESRSQLFKLKVSKETRQLNNSASLRLQRREIARLLTVAKGKAKAEGKK